MKTKHYILTLLALFASINAYADDAIINILLSAKHRVIRQKLGLSPLKGVSPFGYLCSRQT